MPAVLKAAVVTPRATHSNLPGYDACQVIGGGDVSHDSCVRYSSNARNKALCMGCPSPARVCASCFRDQVDLPLQGQVLRKTGLCVFHTEQGPDAVRRRAPEPIQEFKPTPPKQPPGGKSRPGENEEKGFPLRELTELELAEMRIRVGEITDPLDLEVLEHLFNGDRTGWIAHKLGLSSNWVSAQIVRLGKELAVPRLGITREEQQKSRRDGLALAFAPYAKSAT